MLPTPTPANTSVIERHYQVYNRQYSLIEERLTADLLRDMAKVVDCSNDLSQGSRRRRKDIAKHYKYISYNLKVQGCLVLDLDYPAYFAHKDESAPPPNWIVMNKANRHCHYIYKIKNPVVMYDCENTKPMKLLSVINTGLTNMLNADQMYSGHLAKSVWSKDWHTEVVEPYAYGLDELRAEIPDSVIYRSKREQTDCYTSRNVYVFDVIRKWAYTIWWECSSPQEFYDRVYEQAIALNQSGIVSNINPNHRTGLPINEVASIVRQITKWVWQRFSREEADKRFSEIQSRRGSLKGKRRKALLLPKVIDLAAQGLSHRAIAKQLGISPSTITNWLKV